VILKVEDGSSAAWLPLPFSLFFVGGEVSFIPFYGGARTFSAPFTVRRRFLVMLVSVPISRARRG